MADAHRQGTGSGAPPPHGSGPGGPGGHAGPARGGGQHEPSEVGLKAIVWFGVGLALMVGLTVLLTQIVLDRLAARQPRPTAPSAAMPQPGLPPEPRLQTSPTGDLAQMRAREDAVLRSYGWIDRKAGVVRIPIDRAMELIAERGLPVRGSPTPAPTPAPRSRASKRSRR